MNLQIASSTLHWTPCHLHPTVYNRTTSTKSLSFFMSLTNLMVLLPKSHDCNYLVSRRKLAPPLRQLKKHTDLCTHDFVHSPNSWQHLGSLTLPATKAGDFVELLLLYLQYYSSTTAGTTCSEWGHSMTAFRHACGWEGGKEDGVRWKVQITKTK